MVVNVAAASSRKYAKESMGGKLVRSAVVTVVAVYLVWSVPLTSGVWDRGGHATPEHWAYHLLLEQLGFPHHHGSDGPAEAGTGAPAATDGGPTADARSSPAAATRWIMAFPELTALPPDTLLDPPDGGSHRLPAEAMIGRFRPSDQSVPPGARPRPELRPPKRSP